MDMKTMMEQYGIRPLPSDTAEAMAYVPFQPYSPQMTKPVLGYENGTIFTALHKPFYGKKCGGDRDD